MTTKNPAAVALGSIRSPKKAASSRENGKKGGRPNVLLLELKKIEAVLTKHPDFNPWDLGPLQTLKDLRAVIAKAEGR